MIRFRLNTRRNGSDASKNGKGLSVVALTLCFVLLTLALIELTVAALLHLPGVVALSPERVRTVLRSIYRDHVRNIISLSSTATVYSPDLFYTLRPRTRFLFSNIEFSTTVTTNSLGVRDDESSISAPEVVVLGDSFAMGWGVEQDKTFPKLLQKTTGKRTLNAAVSSYGTVREMRMLDRIDTSRLKYLIIAYCDNDYLENSTFQANGNSIEIQSRETLDSIQAAHAQGIRYYPGKYFLALAPLLVSTRAPSNPTDHRTIAEAFLNAVRNGSSKDVGNAKIIVFENKVYGPNDKRFAEALQQVLSEHALPPHLKQMTVLDLSGELGPESHFILDDHMNERGHRAVSARLAPLLRSPSP